VDPEVKASPLESVPEGIISRTLKCLCNPISPTPTQKSGQIVYGCAFLLGEPWDLSLAAFRIWQDGKGLGVFGN